MNIFSNGLGKNIWGLGKGMILDELFYPQVPVADTLETIFSICRDMKSDRLIQEKELVKLKKLMNTAHLTTASNIPSAKIIPIALALSERKSDVEKSEMHTGQILDVYLKTQDAVWSDANILFMAASNAEKVLKELRKQNVKDLTNVRFHAKTTLVDQYNNKSESKIFTLNYNYSEVLKLNMENTSLYQDYLKFAQFESNGRVGRDVFNAWCSDNSNRKFSGSFCSQ